LKSRHAHRRRGVLPVAALIALAAPVIVAAESAPRAVASASAPVSVFPIPNDEVASPRTQLAFRGVPTSQFGTITVRGSKSGLHTGTIEPDSDGHGCSFLPSEPFTPGETVTVTTSMNIRGGSRGSYHFTVATPTKPVPLSSPAFARTRHPGDVERFHSRPDLVPATVKVTVNSHDTAPGYIFLAPQAGPVSDGPMVLDSHAHLIWYKPLPRNELASDVRVQTYEGKPVLTWWQGSWNAGVGRGEDVIDNQAYQQIKVVKAANGMDADLHEFQITRNGQDALITAYYPVYWNESSVHGRKRGIVFDSVVQEIDIATGLVLFQWDSLDHVPLTDSTGPPPKNPGHPYNYFHINSVTQDDDGNVLISGRNVSAVFKVSLATTDTMWQLGGKGSTFRFTSGASFAFQHDVRQRAQGDAVITMFDDGAGPPNVHSQSRGLELRLHFKTHTATPILQDLHSPPLLSQYEGGDQELSNQDDFISWGEQPYFSEYTDRGKLVFDAHLLDTNPIYRAYRFRWNGTPATKPALAVTLSQGKETAYASWNGSTDVKEWRVLGGSSQSSMKVVATAKVVNFETAIKIPPEAYAEVQALSSNRTVLSTSLPERPQ
jgi:hypothetical protein